MYLCFLLGFKQWGYQIAKNSTRTNFPIAFGSNVFALSCVSSSVWVCVSYSSVTLQGFNIDTCHQANSKDRNQTSNSYWIALGK